jgi:methionine synthase II (cobalamin-independent)
LNGVVISPTVRLVAGFRGPGAAPAGGRCEDRPVHPDTPEPAATAPADRTPWPPAAATGIGSMPGTDIAEAVRTVLGELPDLPHLPELPDRGPGADLIGRGAGFLVDLAVDLQPSGWRLVDRPGREARRIRDFLDRDLDTLAELAGEYDGAFKVQVTGPWTLAASLELHYGDKVLADPGAVRDLAASLAEGAAAHVADVGRRLPGARVVLQVDEPSLPAALTGRIPTASGFGTLRAVEPAVAEAALAGVVAAATGAGAGAVAVHCCAPAVPYGLLRRAGASAVSVDLTLLDLDSTAQLDAIGAELDAGLGLWAGVVPGTDARLSDAGGTVSAVRMLWRRLGFDPARLAGAVVVSPTCGLTGASPAYARAALAHCREAARTLLDDPEG